MPIYEYRCSSCGFQKEYLQKITDPLLSSCPDCGEASFRKMLTAAGFHLKGSGWYATDFKGGSAKPRPDKKEAAKTEGAEATKTDATKTEATKTEASKKEAPAGGAGACAASPVAESGN